MLNKIVNTVEEAVACVFDGASIMVGGFGVAGTPHNLVKAIAEKGVKNVTLIANAFSQFIAATDALGVKKVICTVPVPHSYAWWGRSHVDEGIRNGTIEVEIVPQGTLAERIRAGGAGLLGFYTPVGVGTLIAEGKEQREIDGTKCLLELPLKADFALIKADKADMFGNLVYRMAQRNFNPLMATAAKITIVEVDEIVPLGSLSPEVVDTPGIFVTRVVKVPKWEIKPHY